MGDSKSEFREFGKIARLNRDCVVTEKIDGTNAQIYIMLSLAPEPGALAHRSLGDAGDLSLFAGSRSRWITPEDDNHGFAKWAKEHAEELFDLGPGRHFGEWWGSGINRGYGLTKGDKRFSLFNTSRWNADNVPACVSVVPIIYQGPFNTFVVEASVELLRQEGSVAAPGYRNPEGVVVYHVHGNVMFKVTLENDDLPKSLVDKQGKV